MIATIFFSYLTSQKKPISIMNFNWTCKIIPNFNSISTHKKQKSIQIDFSVGPHMLFHWACKEHKAWAKRRRVVLSGQTAETALGGACGPDGGCGSGGSGGARRGEGRRGGRGTRCRPWRAVTAAARGDGHGARRQWIRRASAAPPCVYYDACS